jgi:hypothetical protein
MNKLRMIAFATWDVCRHPPSRKVAWLFAGMWAVVLFLPGLSIALNPNRGLDLTIYVGWSNLICICLDSFMLYTSVRGLLWSYRSKTSPGRGSTRG